MRETKQRILTSRRIRSLFPHPNASHGENTLRGAALIISWVIGVFLQKPLCADSVQLLGVALLVYSFSLLLEFFDIPRSYLLSKIPYALFNAVALFILFLSLILCFDNDLTPSSTVACLAYYLSMIETIFLLVVTVASLVALDKLVFDENNETEKIAANTAADKISSYLERQAMPTEGDENNGNSHSFT